jgi:hypothetical protein
MKTFNDLRTKINESPEPIEENVGNMPPNILILRRQSVRQFPDHTMVALYYNDKLDQHFSIPYGSSVTSVVTPTSMKEETEQLDELSDSTLKSYVEKRGKQVRDSVDSGSRKAKFSHFRGLGKAGTKLLYKAASGTLKEGGEVEQLNEIDMGKKDHEVLKAFLNKKPGSSKKLSTDGKRLDGNWLGGSGIAHHSDKGVHLNDLGSRSAQQVHRAIKKHNSYESHSDVPHHTLLEDLEQLSEGTLDRLRHIRDTKVTRNVPHNDGTTTMSVTPEEAHAVLKHHGKLSGKEKEDFERQILSSRHTFKSASYAARTGKKASPGIDPQNINETIENIQELRKDTLIRYVRSAVKNKDFLAAKEKMGHGDGADKKSAKRTQGILRATTKLEEEVIEEGAIEHLRNVVNSHGYGPLKHKDGKQTTVDVVTANALLTVHDALKPEHQAKFAEHLEKSKSTFHKMVDFTWKNVK